MQRTITRTILIIIATLLLSAVILVGVFSKNYEENVVGRLTVYDDDGATVIESKRKSGILKADNDLLSSYDVTNVVIFIYFQGESKSEFLNSIENFDDHFNGDEISLRDYYSRLSYGTFEVNSIFAMENSQFCVYQASNNRSFYEKVTASKGSTRYNAESGLLNSAVQYADDYFDYQGVDLDVNDDGYVDSVSFVVSGSYTNTTEYWGGLIWPHAWQLDDISKVSTPATSSKTLNGIKVNDYTFTFAKNFSLGLVAHEFGHLLGLPDLYRYDTGTTLIPDRNANYMPVGFWDLMHREHTTPQYVTTYLRYKYLNFALGTQIKEITESGTYTLNPTATALQTETLAYKISVSDKESIYIEYRLRSSSPYEKLLPSDGILVYRINNTVSGNEESKHQSTSNPYEVYVFRPSVATSGTTVQKELENLGYAALSVDNPHFSSLGKKESTKSYDSECIYLTNGANTGIIITPVEEKDGKITFTVDLGTYDNDTIVDSYVLGKELSGKEIKKEHYAYLGEPLDVELYVKYGARDSYVQISDFTLEYNNEYTPEGQTAYAVFTDAKGEHKVPFTLYLYRSVINEIAVLKQPSRTVYSAGDEIDLTGLSVRVTYSSGSTSLLNYRPTEKDLWKVVEGLDMNVCGVYDHVKVTYDNVITFYLAPITVTDKIVSLAVSERDTHRIKSDTLTPKFNVIATYANGSSSPLGENAYTINYQNNVDYGKALVDIVLNADDEVMVTTYVFVVGSAKVTSITVEGNVDFTLMYGQTPDFEQNKLTVNFDDGYAINANNALPLDNYRSEILKNYIPTKTGLQALGYTLDEGSFSVNLTVYVKPDNILSVSSENPNASDIILNTAKNSIYLKKDFTLKELASALNSYLNVSFVNAIDGYELALNTHGERTMGHTTTVTLTSTDGDVIVTYTIYRIGDGNGDGIITYLDRPYWTQDLLAGRNTLHFDVNGDGKYSLTDLTILAKTYGGDILG